MSKVIKKLKIIFTDLDESLLKDNEYYPKVLNKFINKLLSQNYLIVVLTSKTFSKVKNLFKKNNIKLFLNSENGSSFYILNSNNQNNISYKKFINKKAIKSNIILKKLKKLPRRFLSNLIFIKDLSLEEQSKITKLKKSDLVQFNDREFSVSLIWNGNNNLLLLLKKYLKKLNLQASFGGKMLNVSGEHSKLDALFFFKETYIKQYKAKDCITVSIGDSQNDVEMLNHTDYSGIVIRKDKKKLNLIKNQNVFISNSFAPEGWVELLNRITKKMEEKNI